MARKYYLSVSITCDKCGIEDTLDNQTESRDELEPHIQRRYKNIKGKDFCEDCFNESIFCERERK